MTIPDVNTLYPLDPAAAKLTSKQLAAKIRRMPSQDPNLLRWVEDRQVAQLILNLREANRDRVVR